MKCDQLTIYDGQWCDKSEVDEAIAELKSENEQLKAKLDTVNELVKTSKDLYDHAIESLKASHYAEMVDAGMRERRLRRALFKACAMWADRTRLICSVFGSNAPKICWERMFDRCLKKAEEYR